MPRQRGVQECKNCNEFDELALYDGNLVCPHCLAIGGRKIKPASRKSLGSKIQKAIQQRMAWRQKCGEASTKWRAATEAAIAANEAAGARGLDLPYIIDAATGKCSRKAAEADA